MEIFSVGSPVGQLLLVRADGAYVGVYMEDHKPAPRLPETAPGTPEAFSALVEELDGYWTGKAPKLGRTALRAAGTPFQVQVWETLAKIPFGETRTYSWVAHDIGKPQAIRAVASAISKNPLSILIPCHRVIAQDGSLAGYAGGIARKEWLLRHEGVVLGKPWG